MKDEPIQAVLIGAGQRGADSYGPYALAHPDEIVFVAVAEPDSLRRKRFSDQHGISQNRQFESWEALLSIEPLGQAALVCTPDHLHDQPAIAAMRRGYDVLLEKPMAPTLERCLEIINTSVETGRQLQVCHVLRYSKHFQELKRVLDSGVLGQIVNLSHSENVSWWHMAHSFVRGNWRNRTQSSPMILAKCCHDLDLLTWLLEDRPRSLSSVGSLIHFRPENAPPGATKRCLDGCEVADTCPYYAPMIYLDFTPLWAGFANTGKGMEKLAAKTKMRMPGLISMIARLIPSLAWFDTYRGWPTSAITLEPSLENTTEALRDGPYGRCVYHCDNDVVDNQVVNMQFERGTSVTLTMHGHSHIEGRITRIEGSHASLRAEFWYGSSWIEVDDHLSNRKTRIDTYGKGVEVHGGGDFRLMQGFVKAIQNNDPAIALTTAQLSLESHLMAFAAEEARLDEKLIQMDRYRK
jgi:predicted dehydrogenase